MRVIIAIIFPPLAVLSTRRIGAFLLNLLLCLLFWIPAIIHAIYVVLDYNAQKGAKRQGGQGAASSPPPIPTRRVNPVTFASLSLVGTVAFLFFLWAVSLVDNGAQGSANDRRPSPGEQANKPDVNPVVPEIASQEATPPQAMPSPAPAESQTQERGPAPTDHMGRAKALYLELLEMRAAPEFHQEGFAEGSRFRSWFERSQTLQAETKGDSAFIAKGVAVGDLVILANEWRTNKGADTEASRFLDEAWAQAMGVSRTESDPKNKAQEVSSDGVYAPREWTSADGQRKFFGRVEEFSSDEVTILKDEKPFKLTMDKLSQADREFLGQGIAFTTLGGKRYENVSIHRIESDVLTLKSAAGFLKITRGSLPEELGARFPYRVTPSESKRIAAEAARAQAEQQMAKANHAAASKRVAQEQLDTLIKVLEVSGSGNFIKHVSVNGQVATLTVANSWHYEPKQVRLQFAQVLWQAWAQIYSPNDLDKAHIKLVDLVGNEVGGSGWFAGSMVSVKD